MGVFKLFLLKFLQKKHILMFLFASYFLTSVVLDVL